MAKRTTKKKDKPIESELLNALRFIQPIQQEQGTFGQTHCVIGGGTVIAFNGITAIGVPCADDIEACPHTLRLIDALEKCSGTLALTMMAGQLQVKDAEKFTAYVDCVLPEDIPAAHPDPRNWPMDDRFKKAALIASMYNTEGGQTVVESSVVTIDGSIFGTNGKAAVEALHGIGTPPGQILPKSFVTLMQKIDLPIVGFGFSDKSTFTVWYENGAWLKTQQYVETYPEIGFIRESMNHSFADQTEINPGMFEAVKKVAPFSIDLRVYFEDGVIKSHAAENKGASYACPGLPGGLSLNAKNLSAIADYAKTIDLGIEHQTPSVVWYGQIGEDADIRIRGIIQKYA